MPNRRFSSLLTLALTIAGIWWALPVPAEGQEQPRPAPVRTVLKEVKYINPEDTLPLLAALDVEVAAQRALGVLVLRGTEENLKTALEMISSLDVPPRSLQSVDLRIYLVEAGEVDPQPLPPALEEALQPLRSVLGTKSFRLLDTIVLRTAEESRNGQASGKINELSEYQLAFQRVSVLPGEPTSVRLEGFTFGCGSPAFGLRTDVEVRQGQVAVIGKANRDNGGALLVILEANVVAGGKEG